jgi:Heterokaryon incompatibility protein (HET)
MTDSLKMASNSSSQYEYRRLRDPKTDIRLLVLLPSDNSADGDDIRCRLIHCLHQNAYPYAALSYTWGPPNITRTIIIGEKIVQVRENLWWALRYLRLKDGVRLLWIDALSIDQSNVDERNHQVNRMDLIYKKATWVLVWLGTEGDGSREAVKFARKVKTETHLYPYKRPMESPDEVREYAEKWVDFAKLCKRPYWRRLWIIQEVILASSITVHCGPDSISWLDFSSILKQLDEIQYGSFNYDTINQIRQSLPARMRKQKEEFQRAGHGVPLVSLLQIYQEARCSDTRDMVFGLRSLAEDCCRAMNPVDYEKSLLDITEDVLSHHWASHHSSLHAQINVMSVSEHVRRILRPRTENKTDALCPGQSKSYLGTPQDLMDEKLIEARGQLRGSIIYVSHHLNDRLSGRLVGHRIEDLMEESMPTLTEPLKDRLWDLFLSGQGTASRTIAINDLHVVNSVLSYAVDRKFESQEYPIETEIQTTEKFVPRKTRQEEAAYNRREQRGKELFLQILQDSYDEVANSQSDIKCKLFMEENGIIGFVPSAVEKGDLICQFHNSNVLGVLRREHGQYRIIGRATSYVAKAVRIYRKRYRLIEADPNPSVVMEVVPNSEFWGKPIDLFLAPATLQLLTCPAGEVRQHS